MGSCIPAQSVSSKHCVSHRPSIQSPLFTIIRLGPAAGLVTGYTNEQSFQYPFVLVFISLPSHSI